MKIKRTHDKLYLKENRYDKPKEMFKFILKKTFIKKNTNEVIGDFGCAAGEFLYFLNKKLNNKSLIGIDVRKDLLKKAKKFVPLANFIKGSVEKKNILNKDSVDKAFMIGVHPIFDNFEKSFTNLIYWTKPKGKIFICDMFNPHPVDVLLKYKLAKKTKDNFFESGWNIFSQKSVSLFLKRNKNVKNFSFHKFEMPFDLKPQNDPIRSWTIKSEGVRLMINGISIIQPQTLLIINLK